MSTEGFVLIKRTEDTGKAFSDNVETKPSLVEASTKSQGIPETLKVSARQLEGALEACTANLVKLSNTITPWGVAKRSKRLAEARLHLDKSRIHICQLLPALISLAESGAASVADIHAKLIHRENLQNQVKEQEFELQKSNQAASDLLSKLRGLLMKVDGGQSEKREARAAAGGRFDAGQKEDTPQRLIEAVEALLSEKLELEKKLPVSEKERHDLTKRVKDMQEKLRNEVEIRDREIQVLKSSLKKAAEDKDAALGVSKEQVGHSKQSSQLKTLQHRLETARTEVEQAKSMGKANKAAAEQAALTLMQSQEEGKQLAKKLADLKLQKEEILKGLEHSKAEQRMVFSELQQVRSGAAGPLGLHFDKVAPWPRIAYSARGGLILHKAAGCGILDTTKCVPFQYEDHKELEHRVCEDGFILCHTCRASAGF
ncbi:hypothetical protein CEUSTIGMA_g255.t1 [Chlamydomonas eustigma]|uniref:Uncharacterized protein n=1 Tax=Chlamydomonas eustigma TaxID=1157962 RepID=A0A250WQI0_9CHLO|nr:hypothetical protein CEUSTIGMA_g255.t1 [Chlamydomonas eustigma]|eukprot:GAX72800.1 hypothetical protein CEUSTIGMA_g255.t1 [Chlamydomonas eustigma]